MEMRVAKRTVLRGRYRWNFPFRAESVRRGVAERISMGMFLSIFFGVLQNFRGVGCPLVAQADCRGV